MPRMTASCAAGKVSRVPPWPSSASTTPHAPPMASTAPNAAPSTAIRSDSHRTARAELAAVHADRPQLPDLTRPLVHREGQRVGVPDQGDARTTARSRSEDTARWSGVRQQADPDPADDTRRRTERRVGGDGTVAVLRAVVVGGQTWPSPGRVQRWWLRRDLTGHRCHHRGDRVRPRPGRGELSGTRIVVPGRRTRAAYARSPGRGDGRRVRALSPGAGMPEPTCRGRVWSVLQTHLEAGRAPGVARPSTPTATTRAMLCS